MIPWRRLSDSGSRLLLIFSLCLMSLVYGVFAGHYDLFPHSQLRDAKSAAVALVHVLRKESDDFASGVAPLSATGPAVRSHTDDHDDALILVSGGPNYRASSQVDESCLAWLMNREGEVQHIWTFPPDLWADLEKVSRVPLLSAIYPVGVHLLEDGGLLASFQCTGAWPFGIGLARLDRDSNIVWQKECNAHHWFSVTPDGKIVTPTMRVVESPQSIGGTRGRIRAEDGQILEDFVTVMSLDGEVLEEYSMLEAVNRSGLVGIYQGASSADLTPTTNVNTFDPLHLNSVRQVRKGLLRA